MASNRDDRCSGLWVWDAVGGAGGRAQCCVLSQPSLSWLLAPVCGVGGASVLCAGPAAVALSRVGCLNVRSPVRFVLTFLYFRCILAVCVCVVCVLVCCLYMV